MKGFIVVYNKLSNTEMQELSALRSDKSKRPLGRGATAKVYSFPKNSSLYSKYVYRVQKPQDGFDAYPYLEFAQEVVKSKSRHLPKMKFLAYRKDSYGDIVEVVNVLERLDHWVHHHKDVDDYWVNDLATYLRGWEYNGNTLTNVKNKRGFTNSSIRTLRKFFTKNNIDVNDLHEYNVMSRKDGTIVVTDPVC
jgi:hypothetical protein